MEVMGIVALLAVLLVLLIVIVKSAGSKKKVPVIEEKKPPVIISMGNPPLPEAEEEGPEKITIYTFSRSNRVKTCAFCDGENDITATYCNICGKPTNG